MSFPTAITFHGFESSDTVRADVFERVLQLENVVDDILACRVVVEATSRKLHRGRHYGAHVRLALPCVELSAGGKPTLDPRQEDPLQTVADTFDELTSRVENYVRLHCLSCDRYTQSHSRR